MTPEISVIIPSLRPESLEICLRHIITYSKDVDYEIVVVSPFKPPGHERLKHVLEKEPMGTARATNLGYDHSRGKYVLTIADDMLINAGCLQNLIAFMKPHDEKLFLASLRGYDAYGLRNDWGFYGYLLACCPCIKAEHIEQIGGCYFDPLFRSVYCDHDLSLRVSGAGGTVETCPDAWFETISQKDKIYKTSLNRDTTRDHDLFFSRWEPIYGGRVNYARSNQEHMAYSRSVITPLPFKVPPEISWRIRCLVASHGWEQIRDLMRNHDPSLSVSQTGVMVLAREIIQKYKSIPGEIFNELMEWAIDIQNEKVSLDLEKIRPTHADPPSEVKNNGQGNTPLLSICIPTFNRAEFLFQCLTSFIPQISENSLQTIEMVIIDNASTDATESLLSVFLKKYRYIRYFRNEENIGAELNVVGAVGRAKGNYVWIFGDDDLILDGALKKVLNYLIADRFDLFLTNKVVKNRDLTETILEKQNYTSGDMTFLSIMDLCCMFGFYTQLGFLAAVIFRRLPFSAVDPMPYINLGSCYPQNGIFLEAFSGRPCLYISEPLVCQRQYNQRDDQKSGWPYIATVPLIRMFKMLASKNAIKVSSIEQIKEDPLDGKPCTLPDILLASFESIVRRGEIIPKQDWLDTLDVFSSFRTMEYINRIANIYLEYIVKLLSSGKAEEALFHNRYLVAKYPASSSVNRVQGEGLYHTKQFSEAGRAFQRTINLDPRQTPAYIRLAAIRWKEGAKDEATGLLEKAISLEPENPDAISLLSSMLIESGDVEGGIRELERLVKLVPLNAGVHRKLGQTLYQSGQVQAAEMALLKACELDSNSDEVHNDLGVLYWEHGDLQKAIEHMRSARQLNPQNPDVVVNYALIQEARGETAQALDLLEQYSTTHKDEGMQKELQKMQQRVRGQKDKTVAQTLNLG